HCRAGCRPGGLAGRPRGGWGARRRTLRDPAGPPDLDHWRDEHLDLHPSGTMLAAARAHFEERYLEWRPYLYRWLRDPASEEVEALAVGAGGPPAPRFWWGGGGRAPPRARRPPRARDERSDPGAPQ